MKYILIEWNMDTNLDRVQQTRIFHDFVTFRERVDKILSGSGPDSIIFAGQVNCEYHFEPVEVVKKYQWITKFLSRKPNED